MQNKIAKKRLNVILIWNIYIWKITKKFPMVFHQLQRLSYNLYNSKPMKGYFSCIDFISKFIPSKFTADIKRLIYMKWTLHSNDRVIVHFVTNGWSDDVQTLTKYLQNMKLITRIMKDIIRDDQTWHSVHIDWYCWLQVFKSHLYLGQNIKMTHEYNMQEKHVNAWPLWHIYTEKPRIIQRPGGNPLLD